MMTAPLKPSPMKCGTPAGANAALEQAEIEKNVVVIIIVAMMLFKRRKKAATVKA